jgi:hypothetical protein
LYKVGLILALGILLTGCTVTRPVSSIGTQANAASVDEIIKVTESQNITGSSFFIEKGRISTSGEGGRINLMFTMKFAQPGIFLISLKSITGIEAFRVFITTDTVLINDRINKVTLYGRPYDFEKISGLPGELLNISVGDLFVGERMKSNETGCSCNSLHINDYYRGLIINSIIDCTIGKAKSVTLTSGIPNEQINIFYSGFRSDLYRLPRRVEVNDFRRNVKILIRIDKYTVPWTGGTEFIPGAGYKLRKLL